MSRSVSPRASIRATVTNTGANGASDVVLNLFVDETAGYVGGVRQRVGNLAKGESRTVGWTFRPKDTFSDTKVTFRLDE